MLQFVSECLWCMFIDAGFVYYEPISPSCECGPAVSHVTSLFIAFIPFYWAYFIYCFFLLFLDLKKKNSRSNGKKSIQQSTAIFCLAILYPYRDTEYQYLKKKKKFNYSKKNTTIERAHPLHHTPEITLSKKTWNINTGNTGNKSSP